MNKTKKIILIIVIVACVFWLGAYALMLIKSKAKKGLDEVDESEAAPSSGSTSGSASSDKSKSPFHKGSDTRTRSDNPVQKIQKLCNFYGTRAGRSRIDEDGVWGGKTEEAVEALTHTTIKTTSGATLNYLQSPYIQGETGSRRIWASDLNKMIRFHNQYHKKIKVQ